jgi:hypothetical protein
MYTVPGKENLWASGTSVPIMAISYWRGVTPSYRATLEREKCYGPHRTQQVAHRRRGGPFLPTCRHQGDPVRTRVEPGRSTASPPSYAPAGPALSGILAPWSNAQLAVGPVWRFQTGNTQLD